MLEHDLDLNLKCPTSSLKSQHQFVENLIKRGKNRLKVSAPSKQNEEEESWLGEGEMVCGYTRYIRTLRAGKKNLTCLV